MIHTQKIYTEGAGYALGVLRLVTAFLYIQHATAKFWQWPLSMTDGHGAVPLFSMMGAAGVLELIGGVLLLLGLFVRPTAFILCGQMAVAYLFIHMPSAGMHTLLMPQLNKGEMAVLYCFIFLYLSVAGGGRLAVDNWRK
ncbi:DoxX family protein [Snodgrassella sp.]|uniref:DoxX family protein n=1 Tax=Snodgrassella sp. TaxID=2815304 RepID=UPI002583DA7F|nr:DoxX family protein [Snodgrassella sp.]MCO6517654.1 DoxX family protein [Snodgrassella sp.]